MILHNIACFLRQIGATGTARVTAAEAACSHNDGALLTE